MTHLMLLLAAHAVGVVFLVSFAARIGLPVPAAPVLIVAGALGATGSASLAATTGAAVVASVLGNGLWFYAGRRFGYRFMRLLCRISMSPDSCVRRSESLITRWGGLSLVAARFVPGVSVVAPPMAGALGMSWWRFLGFETAAALLWTVLFLGLGYAFHDQIQDLLDTLTRAGSIATAALVIAVLLSLAVRYRRRRAVQRLTAMPRISVDELHALMDSETPPLIIDVRGDAGLQLEPRLIPGAMPLSLKAIQHRGTALPFEAGREVVLYCNCPNEVSAAMAARALSLRGVRRARPLAGGLEAWVASGRPTVAAA